MDRVGARNTLIVLLTLVVLTLAVWFVLLLRWATDKDVDGNLLAAGTSLLGLLTGSAVRLGATPKVPVHAAPAASVGPLTTVNMAPAAPATDASPADDEFGVDDYTEPGDISAQDLGLPGDTEPLPEDDNLHDTEAEDV